jgi:hypothetical protein
MNYQIKSHKTLAAAVLLVVLVAAVFGYLQTNKDTGMDYLIGYDGKYPADVGLLEDARMVRRLKKLLGGSQYEFLRSMPKVEAPMQVADDIFTANVCQQHDCAQTNVIIVVNIPQNIVYAGIRRDTMLKTYAECGEIHPYIELWEQQQE